MERTIQYINLEETLNNLLSDPAIRQRRGALASFVRERLRQRALDRWREKGKPEETDPEASDPEKKPEKPGLDGISEEMEQRFLSQETGRDTVNALLETFQAKAMELGLSQRKIREFRRLARVDRIGALEEMKQMLLEEELIRFRKENKLTAKVWLSFLNCTVLPGESTLAVLRKGLKLKAEEVEAFNALVIRDVFFVEEPLYQAVHRYLKQTGLSTMDFYNYACIGKDAWDSFYRVQTAPGAPARKKKTSQGTLLKLIIGFALEEGNAWEFMATAGSTFAVRRDLVFLACIRKACYDPADVDEILEFFNDDGYGGVWYKNPYAGYFT